jgi:hypothetical protein
VSLLAEYVMPDEAAERLGLAEVTRRLADACPCGGPNPDCPHHLTDAQFAYVFGVPVAVARMWRAAGLMNKRGRS